MMVRSALVVVVAAAILFVGCGSDASTVSAPAISTPIATFSPLTSPAATSTPRAAASTPNQLPLTAEALAQFAAYIEDTRRSFNVPGMAVVVVQGGDVAFAQGFGVREAGRDDPITPDTLFSIGSTAKAMTAMMAATLVDEGLITWDTPVVDVMPQFQLSDADATGKITLRHLFAHTTGLPNTDLALFFAELPPEGIVEFFKDVPLNTQPGGSRTYQNEAFAVGGYVAAMAAGGRYGDDLLETYVDLMQQRVFDPIGMSTATFSIKETEANPNHATPHYTTLNGTLAQTGFEVTPTHFWDTGSLAPAGEVRASALDVGRFLITMLSEGVAPDGARVVSRESLAETWTQQIEMLGWRVSPQHPDGLWLTTKGLQRLPRTVTLGASSPTWRLFQAPTPESRCSATWICRFRPSVFSGGW